jgi:hypothetical protein
VFDGFFKRLFLLIEVSISNRDINRNITTSKASTSNLLTLLSNSKLRRPLSSLASRSRIAPQNPSSQSAFAKLGDRTQLFKKVCCTFRAWINMMNTFRSQGRWTVLIIGTVTKVMRMPLSIQRQVVAISGILRGKEKKQKINCKKTNRYYPGVYIGGNSTTSCSGDGMRTPLSSCSKIRCIKDSVSSCGTVIFVPSRLVCDSLRARRDDEEEISTGDEISGRSGIPPLLDVLGKSEGRPLRANLLEMDTEGRDRPLDRKVEVGFEKGEVTVLSACDLRLSRLRLKKNNNRGRRSEMRTSPPITLPMIASVGFL